MTIKELILKHRHARLKLEDYLNFTILEGKKNLALYVKDFEKYLKLDEDLNKALSSHYVIVHNYKMSLREAISRKDFYNSIVDLSRENNAKDLYDAVIEDYFEFENIIDDYISNHTPDKLPRRRKTIEEKNEKKEKKDNTENRNASN